MNDKIIDKHGKERQISQRSLENLKLGAEARNQDKQRTNLTLLPVTVTWLKGCGNASAVVDELVAKAKAEKYYPGSEPIKAEPEQVKQPEPQLRNQAQVLEILTNALHLKANAGGAIKAEIKKALELLQQDPPSEEQPVRNLSWQERVDAVVGELWPAIG